MSAPTPNGGAGGDGPSSWVQFDEEGQNNQHAGGRTTPPAPIRPVSPSQQIQETPPRQIQDQDPPQPVLPPPPQKQPRNSAPVPLSQLPNNPLAPRETESPPTSILPPPQAKSRQKMDSAPAVIDAQSVQVSLEPERPNTDPKRGSSDVPYSNGVHSRHATLDTRISMSQLNAAQLQNVPLNEPNANNKSQSNSNHQQQQQRQQEPIIRQGFANGDVIVTLLPQNASLPWVTPAKFRPELVPEELMAQGLTLTVEDYVHIMSQLVSDPRFTLYNICYKRILICWIFLGFVILLSILFSGLQQIQLFGAGIAWLLVNAGAIFFCMWVKIKLNKSLEECIAEINLQLMKHKILLGLDDRGKLSCHKVNLCFIYFDPEDCLAKLQNVLSKESRNGRPIPKLNQPNRQEETNPDVIMSGATNSNTAQQQDPPRVDEALRLRAEQLLGKYSQRWGKDFLRKRLDWSFDTSARMEGLSSPSAPRHLSTARCLCQYIEEHLAVKIANTKANSQPCCLCLTNFCSDAEF